MEQTSANPRPKIIALRDLFRGTWDVYRQNWQKFAALLIVPLLISYVFSLASFALTSNLAKPAWSWPAWAIAFIIFIAVMAAIAVLYIMTYIAEFLLLKDLSQEVSFKNLGQWYERAKPYFWIAVAITFFYTLLAMVGFILLIIPGIIFTVLYCFAIYAVIFEDHKFEGAFGRSRELVRGYFWPVFGRFMAVGAVIYLAYVVIGGIWAGIVWLIANGLQLQSSQELFSLMYNLLSIFIGLIVGPLSLIYTYKIYQSLKAVKNI